MDTSTKFYGVFPIFSDFNLEQSLLYIRIVDFSYLYTPCGGGLEYLHRSPCES
jgi:hypothetical protein